MKRILLITITMITAFGGFAQSIRDIAQPKDFVGRRINASGEITREFGAYYSYTEEGKLQGFAISDYHLSGWFTYTDDYLTREIIHHRGGTPDFDEWLNYAYEDGRIKGIYHGWDAMNSDEAWNYYYDDYGRLIRKNYGKNSTTIYDYYEYAYENGSKTRIESHYTKIIQDAIWVWAVRHARTFQYSDDYQLLSVRTDTYNDDGEVTQSKLLTYSYTPAGKTEEQIEQTLVDDEWVNTSIMRYVYDEFDRVTEQQNGTWSQDNGDWNINKKVVFDMDDDDLTYTVSFYKKSGDEWTWDVFANQTLFFESVLKEQQRALGYFVYEDMNGMGNINQFVFNMEFTETPVYLSTQQNNDQRFCVYPNPGNDIAHIAAPVENAVVRFFDLQGRLIQAQPFDFTTSISTGGWPSGVYYWEIWNGSQKEASGKWVKD